MKLNKPLVFTTTLLAGIALLAGSTLLNSCKNNAATAYELTGDTIADGNALAQIHCTKCHSLVPVNALSKTVWLVHSLPAMSQFLGISTYGTDYYKGDKDTTGLSLLEWQSIVAYYKKMAPDSLIPAKAPSPLLNDWAGFTLQKPAKMPDLTFTTLVSSSPNTGKLYTGDVVSGNFTEWSQDLKPANQTKLPSAAVNVEYEKDTTGAEQAIITCIGRLDPIDFPNGRVLSLNLSKKGSEPSDLATELPRPVQTLSVDLDKDGVKEIVVLGQGRLKGGVYLLKQSADHKSYKQFTITDRAGAVQAVTGDYNKDGYPDLMILFGENNEGLALFLNDHKGGFTSKDLINFPPTNGSTSFQLADMDHDGNLDLIYTCGYNFRDSRILKPYHGLYIYKNTGDFKFKQSWFYPINGCTKAIATDFDKDGDLDIATIAFFADMKDKPAEEFVYFEQDKQMSFKAHAVPVSQNGRWISMEVADHNRDGKPDIILGNYAAGFLFQPNFTPNWDEHTPYIVLQNNMK